MGSAGGRKPVLRNCKGVWCRSLLGWVNCNDACQLQGGRGSGRRTTQRAAEPGAPLHSFILRPAVAEAEALLSLAGAEGTALAGMSTCK